MKVFDFKTDYFDRPLCIENPPRFSWRTDAEQAEYRLTVQSETDSCACFDTGWVNSPENIGIAYVGQPLRSDCRYVAEVSVQGKDGARASQKTYFCTALLEPADWKGKWVSVPSNFSGQSLLVRKSFDLPAKPIARATCFVAGLGYHELYVNGSKIGNAVLQPGVTDVTKRVYYVAYDVKEHLAESGTNVIGIMLGTGWQGEKLLLLQMNIHFADGSVHQEYTTNGMWWATGGAITRESIYGGETYDARKEIPDWSSPAYEAGWDSGWMYLLRSVHPPLGKLVCQPIEEIKVCGAFRPIHFTQFGEKQYVYDMGQNLAGWCRIRVRGESGAKVTLRHAEDVKEDGTINTLNLRTAECKDEYYLKGCGIEEYAPRFTYRGFRYVEVTIEGEAEMVSIQAEHVHTDVPVRGLFECSDEDINRLHRMAMFTEVNNIHSILTDCPQRDERFMWLNDLSSRIFQTVHNFGMEHMFPKIVQDIADTQNESGEIADTAPYFTAQRPADPVCVCFLLFALLSYRWYGDRRCVEEHYSELKSWTEYLLKRQKDYILEYGYYADWVCPPVYDEQTDAVFVSSAYLYWHLCIMRDLAQIVGNAEDEERYRALRKEAKDKFNAHFYDGKRKQYYTGSQAANSIALNLGLVPKNDRMAVAKNVMDNIRSKNMHLSCGNQGYRHLFYALGDMGYAEELLQVITNPEYPGWGYMLACGATTVWERWEHEMQREMHSFDHPMFASYDGWFYECFGGIRVCEDAFAANKICIAPNVSNHLSFVRCEQNTVRGLIRSNWKKTESKIEYEIEIPVGVSAEIRLQGMEPFQAGSGVHRFEVPNEKKKILQALC